MNTFLFWIGIISIILTIYLISIYRRSAKGFRFQVKLTIIFILLVLVPAIPLTSFVSALLSRGVEMFLLPGVEDSLSGSLEVIKLQLEERGEIFFKNYSGAQKVDQRFCQSNNVLYCAHLTVGQSQSELTGLRGLQTNLINDSPVHQLDIKNAILRGEIKSHLFEKENRVICEVYRPANNELDLVAFDVDPKINEIKNNVSESLRIYNSLTLFKKSVVEGQLIWGFATLFIMLLTIIAVYAAKSLSRGISGPIRTLSGGMQRVAAGDLNYSVKVKAKDEIKFLVDSFNKMSADLKTSQQKLVEAERLSAWQDLARKVSHEIKNALTPIQLSLRRLWNRIDKENETEINDFMFTIQDELEALRRISEEFSDFARMPKVNLQKEDLNEIIRSLITFIGAEPRSVSFKLNLDQNLSPMMLDRTQIRRALHNIIKNAIEASESKKGADEIWIETSQLKDGENNIKILIKDFGTGMSPEIAERIFDPYYTTKKRGMGLGLSIVKRIIEDHNGEIKISSKLGRGTVVEILF